ncbi:hypothetical protein Tco_1540491 [Tanacetum coccineum]
MSFLLCSCLLAPRRENTLVDRKDACDVDILPHPILSSDPKQENTLLDQADDVSSRYNSRMADGVTELVGKSRGTPSSILTMLRTDPSTLGVSFTVGLMFLGPKQIYDGFGVILGFGSAKIKALLISSWEGIPRLTSGMRISMDVDNVRSRSSIKEHPACFNRYEEYVDGVSDDGSAAYDHMLQFLEERNEKNLSWRLLKLSRGNKSMKSYDRTSGHIYNLILQRVAKARGSKAAFGLFEELVSDDEHKKKVDKVLFNMMLTLCRDEIDWIKSE